jgi:effector-binding domain-containing protein
MKVEIINQALTLDVYGFSGTAINKDYSGEAFKLMDRMWKVVRAAGLQNNGMNIWIYEPGEIVFAGIELTEIPRINTELQHKIITLTQYAHSKHIGPYNLIKQTGQNMRDELKQRGFKTVLPYIEIYGHWTSDESKLETELLMCLK